MERQTIAPICLALIIALKLALSARRRKKDGGRMHPAGRKQSQDANSSLSAMVQRFCSAWFGAQHARNRIEWRSENQRERRSV
jgi:hypothetical protein